MAKVQHFSDRYGPWALVTGASAGLGEEFAGQLAARGLNLVLAARRKDRLGELADRLASEQGVEARTVDVDLSAPDFIEPIRKAAGSLDIGLLVNNAGFGLYGAFLDHDLEREVAMLDVNCRAPLILAHEFGRKMTERGRGGIVFVSSILGVMSAPLYANYAATKAYDLFLGEALWGEWRSKGVHVLTLCPGPTKTEFQEVSGVGRHRMMRPEPVVAAALRNLGRKPMVVAGWQNRALCFIHHLLPRKLRILLLQKAMRQVGGRK